MFVGTPYQFRLTESLSLYLEGSKMDNVDAYLYLDVLLDNKGNQNVWHWNLFIPAPSIC